MMNDKGMNGNVTFGNTRFMPKEEHLETAVKNRRITIGIPCDNKEDEKRVALTPEAVNLLVESNNEVIVQKGAGLGANYSDKDYSENGAMISESPARVYSADVVIKVAPFSEKDTNYLKGNQVLISYLNVLKLTEETLSKLIRKKVTAIAFEKIRNMTGEMPVIEAMSEISGVTSLLIASEYLSNTHGGKGVMLGGVTGVTPTEVVILGANTAGEYAARGALGLGSQLRFLITHWLTFGNFRIILVSVFKPQYFIPRYLKRLLNRLMY